MSQTNPFDLSNDDMLRACRILYPHARETVEINCMVYQFSDDDAASDDTGEPKDWYSTKEVMYGEERATAEAIWWLETMGLIERHPSAPTYIRVKDFVVSDEPAVPA